MAAQPVEEWTKEQFCHEFWASVEEFYASWKKGSGGRLPDWEAAVARGKREGILPHPAFAKTPGEMIREGDVHKGPEDEG